MKRFDKKHKVEAFKPRKDMVGDGGWKISYNELARRYDLKNSDESRYSHMARAACVYTAQKRHDVVMHEAQ